MAASVGLVVACVAVSCPSLYFASSLPATRPLHSHHASGTYVDDDGEALSSSPAQSARFLRVLLPGLSSISLLLAFVSWLFHGHTLEDGIITFGWTVANVNAFYFAREPLQPRRYTIALWMCLSAATLSLALGIAWYGTQFNQENGVDSFAMLLRSAQLILGLGIAVISVSLERRPEVYLAGRAVDRQYTCSAWDRYTFAWVRPLLDRARRSRSLEYSDLPALGRATRSRELRESLSFNSSPTLFPAVLWKTIIRDHFATVVKQWTLGIVEGFVMLLPPFFLYRILVVLESRHGQGSTESTASLWPWILCLALSKILHVALSNWLQWVSFALFAIPVKSQLSAAVFAKSLKLKNLHSISSTSDQADDSTLPKQSVDHQDGGEEQFEMDTLLPQDEPSPEGKSSNKAATDDKASQGLTTGIVNLLAVDIERVSLFCGFNVDLGRGAAKILAAVVFLVLLMGWWSTIAGFAIPMLLQPLTNIATKHYTGKQLAVMAARDDKAHIVTEVLHGIRQIKFSASEPQWEKRILTYREAELQAQREVYTWAIFLTFLWISMPALIGATALSVYAVTGQRMVPSVAFTALSLFASLEWTLGAVPATITEMLDARVSINRIQRHLESGEQQKSVKFAKTVELKSVHLAWPADSDIARKVVLSDLSLQFPPNQLRYAACTLSPLDILPISKPSYSVISGRTGTGKSLLLAAIIGEADLVSGEIYAPWVSGLNDNSSEASSDIWIRPNACAYVSQVPWIENASVKETILFGLPYNRKRYLQVISDCALIDDIKMLPDGDSTEIGATGINLSGGQRWRLTFARALYSRAGLLVLDDIFSAVDSHVGRHLLERALLGPLGINRTRILVTHHIGLVEPYASYMVTLQHDKPPLVVSKEAKKPSSVPTSQKVEIPEALSSKAIEFDDETRSSESTRPTPRKFTVDETRQQGRVKWSVYGTYLKASGGLRFWGLALSLFSMSALLEVSRSYWLALWTRAYAVQQGEESDSSTSSSSPSQPHLVFYLTIYISIALAATSMVGAKVAFLVLASLRAARRLFEMTTSRVLRAPLRWLDTEPVGRILNRFIGDFALIDGKLGGDVTWCANGVFTIVAIIVAALSLSPWMLLFVCMLAMLCIYVVYLYLDAARDVKRLESTAKSPIFELVGSSLLGLSTIRTFDKADEYLARMYHRIDTYAQASWHIWLTAQWMRVRQGLLGVFFTVCIAVAIAVLPNIDAALAGFALSFALDFSTVAEESINRYTSTELDMNSAERVLEYSQLSTEPLSGATAATAWPSEGRIVVRNLEVGYASDLESVLKGISFAVQPRERVGIVGRTGSGKSSLTLSLFRFLEARQGSIEIDDQNISSLKLHDLRSRLAIIPQDPVLFSGTLRSNMDPFDEHDDDTLLNALSRVTPSSASSSSVLVKLGTTIARGGSNLSQGEKQLVCLARAILARPKILVLDEATSAVDMETDSLIQRSIREDFQQSTLLVVAHRLSTVADFDKILVLDEGRVAEFDRPDVLAQMRGLFWKMLSDSGEHKALEHLLQKAE